MGVSSQRHNQGVIWQHGVAPMAVCSALGLESAVLSLLTAQGAFWRESRSKQKEGHLIAHETCDNPAQRWPQSLQGDPMAR